MADKQSFSQSFSRRVKYLWLAFAMLGGLGMAAFEKYRAEEASQLFAGPFRFINNFYLDPIRMRAAPAAELIGRIPGLWTASNENDNLRRALSGAMVENQLLQERLARMERLTGLGQWTAPPPIGFLQADVVSFHDRDESAVLIVNRGRRDGVRPRDPVVALGGLVGVVREVSEAGARVQTLADPLSAIGVFDRRTRSRGVVEGQGVGKDPVFVPENEAVPIVAGTELITSGFDNSIYPKGLLVGTITGKGETLYGEVHGTVKPAVSLDAVEEVLILVRAGAGESLSDAFTSETLGMYSIHMPLVPAVADDLPTTAVQALEEAALNADAPTSGALRLGFLQTQDASTSGAARPLSAPRAPLPGLAPGPAPAEAAP